MVGTGPLLFPRMSIVTSGSDTPAKTSGEAVDDGSKLLLAVYCGSSAFDSPSFVVAVCHANNVVLLFPTA